MRLRHQKPARGNRVQIVAIAYGDFNNCRAYIRGAYRREWSAHDLARSRHIMAMKYGINYVGVWRQSCGFMRMV
jgi:hypothetical protein